jgi:hypothetical protein
MDFINLQEERSPELRFSPLRYYTEKHREDRGSQRKVIYNFFPQTCLPANRDAETQRKGNSKTHTPHTTHTSSIKHPASSINKLKPDNQDQTEKKQRFTERFLSREILKRKKINQSPQKQP